MNLFIFDFDGTITKEDVTDLVLEIPSEDRIWEIEKEWREGRITSYECMKEQARFLKGLTTEEVYEHLRGRSHLDPCFPQLVRFLEKAGFRTVILSEGYDLAIRFHQVKKYVEDIHCSELLAEDGKLTGELKVQNGELWGHNKQCIGCCTCKVDYLRQLGKKVNLSKSFAVGDGRSDECLFQHVDVSFSLNPEYKATYEVKNLCDVLGILKGMLAC